MSGYQPGDRLRITVEATADTDLEVCILDRFLSVDDLEAEGATIERILPPLVVGQPVPLDRLDELPDGSVVARPSSAATTAQPGWIPLRDVYAEPLILLRLGDGTPDAPPAPEPLDACGRGVCALGAGHGGKCRT